MDHKQAVEAYFKHDRSLMGGRNLYNRLPGKNRAMQNAIARFTDTPKNVDKLCYELAKAVGIPDRQRIILTQNPVVPPQDIEVEAEVVTALEPNDQLMAFNPETANYKDAKALAKALELTPASQKKADVFAALATAREALVKKN